MSQFKKISCYDLDKNPFDLIGKKWALLTAQNGEEKSTMTISWGGVGVLWNKPCAFIFVRPQRNTRKIIDTSNSFSLSFFDESYKEKLSYCGKFSSKNVDKFEQCGFDIEIENQIPYIKQAELVFCCKKLFKQQFSPQSFIDKDLLSNYPQEDYHFLYVGEIEAALIK